MKRASRRNVTVNDVINSSVVLRDVKTFDVSLTLAMRADEDRCARVTLKLDDYAALALAEQLVDAIRKRAERVANDVETLREKLR